jgi:hypothetical protein
MRGTKADGRSARAKRTVARIAARRLVFAFDLLLLFVTFLLVFLRAGMCPPLARESLPSAAAVIVATTAAEQKQHHDDQDD